MQETRATNKEPMMLFQDLTNLNCVSSRVQGTRDNDAGCNALILLKR